MHYDPGAAELSKPNVQPRGTNMPRVLVVDDDPMVCMAIEIYLERHDFQVTIADGGEAGLRALESATFDLMIVDIFMPHMRGFEFDQDIPRARADDAADCDVRLRLRESQFARARFPADGARTRRVALSAQTVHAGGAADRDQRMSFGSAVPRSKRHSSQITSPAIAGGDSRSRELQDHASEASRGGSRASVAMSGSKDGDRRPSHQRRGS